MSFNEKLPEWFNEGLEPTTLQKNTGYVPGIKPPAQWFNWHLNRSYQVMKELQEQAVHREDFEPIEQRLNTVSRQDVTLQPGIQIINAAKSAPFSLEYLTGRMLVNLLGRYGGCEALGPWEGNIALITDATKRTSGMSSFRLTLGSVAATATITFNTRPGLYYVFASDVQVPTGVSVSLGVIGATSVSTTTAGSWQPLAHRFVATDYFHQLRLSFTGPSGSVCWMDSVRVYEVSEADYNAMASMTLPERAAKYPYVDSVKPVRNPYVIRYGENLLPPFYEWNLPSTGAAYKVQGPYELQFNGNGSSAVSLGVNVSVIAGQQYTISVDSGGIGSIGLNAYDKSGALLDAAAGAPFGVFTKTDKLTFTSPVNVSYIKVLMYRGSDTAEPLTFSNPMLNIGSTALPFTPREDSMLALQTDLYADPLTGDNADSVFERDGQYFKNKIWNRVLLDGSWSWVLGGSVTGYKLVYTNMIAPYNPATWSPTGFRYDGKILDRAGGEISGNSGGTLVQLKVFGSDSGWGDSYTDLTPDEIKAYFMGWRMRDQVTTAPYNGGVKAWGSLMSGGTDYYTNTLPTTVAPDYKTPYEFVYRLATPTVEPIVSEGQLTLDEGSNQVEVGTGIVLRESAPIYGDPSVGVQINRIDMPLKNRVSKILMVYKDSQSDRAWKRDSSSAYGLERAYVLAADGVYNKSSAYSSTYLMLDTSPVAAFVGSVSDNEKSLLADLVQDVQQASTRLSVVENKKAEKDSPAWIAPIFLNGWVSYGNGTRSGFMKRSDGMVMVEIIAVSGADNSTVFTLPPGYRPSQTIQRAGLTSNGTTRVPATVDILANGRVNVYGTYTTALNLAFSFLAE